MNIYIKSIVRQLKNHSATLERTSIFLDKPWALIDDELEMQKLIFKGNKELILSKNGQVQMGKWDYFPEAKSILIDRGNNDRILCNEAFIDRGVMILRKDGTDNNFFILANENVVPDLDANRYLKELRYQKLKIIESKLFDGRILEVQREENQWETPEVGNPVTVNAEPIADGKYQLEKRKNINYNGKEHSFDSQSFEVKGGRIFKILTETKYNNQHGQEIFIEQQDFNRITQGDYVFMFGLQVNDAIIDFSKSENLIVKDGVVLRLEPKNKVSLWFYKLWYGLFQNPDEKL
jgi:hypothetical protein